MFITVSFILALVTFCAFDSLLQVLVLQNNIEHLGWPPLNHTVIVTPVFALFYRIQHPNLNTPNPRNPFRFLSGEQLKQRKFDCGFCGGQQGHDGHVICSCMVTKALAWRCKTLLRCARFLWARQSLSMSTRWLQLSLWIVLLVAIVSSSSWLLLPLSPAPIAWAPTSIARWSHIAASWDLSRRPRCTVVTTWGRVLDWCATISRTQSTSSLLSVPRFVACLSLRYSCCIPAGCCLWPGRMLCTHRRNIHVYTCMSTMYL